MPEQYYKQKPPFQGEQGYSYEKKLIKLCRKITDVVPHKLFGMTTNDPEYFGLREVLTEEMIDVLLKLKQRKHYTFEDLVKKFPEIEPAKLQKLFDDMSVIGIIEYDYGDNYAWDHPLEDKPKIKRYMLSYFVPGSAELMNSSVDRIAKNPAVASFFERMTFVPLAGVTEMLPPGGGGVGMHVIPVEKAIENNQEAIDVEKISHWMDKYEGHISAGICSCRASRAMIGDGCIDDVDDWCVQFGDMADYTVETNRAHYITKERALEIFQAAEKNGFVHQITNIDGENKIFDICNCDVKICNALRTALLFNTPYLERSAYSAKVDKTKCVACGQCVSNCPAGAVKLGQKLCKGDGKEQEYPLSVLPDKIKWGKYAWDENYRDTARKSDTWATGTAPCKVACPAHVPVQGYLQKAKEGKYVEALALIKTQNPFPAVCGRVCNKKCEEACTRGKVDAPVSIDAVKKFVADFERSQKDRYIPEKIMATLHEEGFPEKIAIIGAGPAGLSAAYYLCEMGFKPTVFEKNEKPGGMMMYGIPSYKLEKDVIEDEIDIIRKMGAEIKCGVEVGKDVTIAQLKEQGYKAFYIAIGCQGGRRPNVPNDTAKGTDIAVSYLKGALGKQVKFTGDVVVVGGGNVAIDCVRTAHRLGSKNVQMFALESRETMPASKEEISETLDEGILINNGWGPKELKVNAKGEVTEIVFKKCTATLDKDGKFNPQYDESEIMTVKADKVIFAIGQAIEWGNLLEGSKVTFWHGNYPLADKLTYQTADDDIFVGGDVFTGPKFVINAIAAGHEVADALARHVRPNAHPTIAFNRRGFTPLNKDDITLPGYDEAGRQEAGMDEKIDHKNSFKDAHKTLTEEQVHIETSRCLSCGAAHVDFNKCIGCGVCTTKCKFDAIHLVRDHPECSNMKRAEDKVGTLLKYALKREVKILLHSGSKEARMMRKKRKEWNKYYKTAKKEKPWTGNAVE
ncbi:MAG: pyridine nucleotide-disulfide oxidoreductase [Erysipelotrichaceae bacterium]|jgi:NADPH-dependent glutamate synthase beta subunit-like oxidoreductase|nr:pyridine nucleotide-disulfide oxidoreductase [Erysipelotrichaceae bacterium]